MTSSNPLRRFVETTRGRQIRKYEHYYDVYHRHLAKFRGRKIVVVEFGVHMGGSAQMWREYFGADVMIYGIDITPECKRWQTDWFKVFIGDQSDRAFLAQIAAEIGPIDVLIEDGGHRPEQQIATFEVLYPQVKPGGVFLIEDLHTSYWSNYDGGYLRPGTFMEYAKPLTDQLNAFHSREPGFAVDAFTRTTTSMHFYDSIVVFEKGRVGKPRRLDGGRSGWERRPDTDVVLSRGSLLRTDVVRARRRAAPVLRRALRRVRALQVRGRA